MRLYDRKEFIVPLSEKKVEMLRLRTLRQILRLSTLAALIPSAAGAQEPLTLDSCRKLATMQNRKLRAARMGGEIEKNLVRSARTLYLPRVDFAGGWYYMGQKDVVPNANELFLPIVPYKAIDRSTGTLNPTYFEENPIETLKYLAFDIGKLQPMLDDNGNPIFRRYAYLPGSHLALEPKHLWIMGFTLRQPIFTSLKIVAANRMAEAMGAMASNKAKATEAEIIEKCDAAYWQVLSVQEKRKLAMQYEALVTRFETDVQNLVDEGMATRNDLLRVQTRCNEARMQSLRASNGETLARQALAQILGVRIDQAVVSPDALDVLPEAFESDELDSATDEHPELNALRNYQELLKASVMMINSSYMPDIYLFGQYSWKHPNPYAGMSKEFGGDWSVGVTLRWPILTWGDRIYKTRIAQIKVAESEAELEEAESLIALQRMQKLHILIEARRQIEFATHAAAQADTNLAAVRESFAEGACSLRDVLEAQTLWQEAQLTLLEAKLNAANASTSLSRAAGTLNAPAAQTTEHNEGNEKTK